MSHDLNGRVAIITGGARGIGLAITKDLAQQGANVIIVGRREAAQVAPVLESLQSDYDSEFHYVGGDVGDPLVAREAVKIAFSTYKRLDILVNNAGVLQDGLIGMISDNNIQETLNTNVVGMMNFTQTASRLMERTGSGSIINMSSIIGRFGNRGQMVYAASKAAVIGITLSAAKELAPKQIRVNAIAPGYIDTDMIAGLDEETDKLRRDSIGMGRIGLPEDISKLALFLASDNATYITGQTIGVDGAMII